MNGGDIMEIQNNKVQTYSQKSETRTPTQELGKDEFLKLLVTQLRNQNPLEPLDDKEFIAQMAQFSSLEQMQNMNENLGELLFYQREMVASALLSEAVSLIGKEVKATDPETGESIIGVVEKVRIKEGIAHLIIDGVEIPSVYVEWVSAMQKTDGVETKQNTEEDEVNTAEIPEEPEVAENIEEPEGDVDDVQQD